MKTLILTFFCSFLSLGKGMSQSIKYDQFIKYVGKHLNPPKSVKETCDWQYAVVKIQTDKNNRIVAYSLLNPASDELMPAFKFLINYQFPLNMPIKNRPIVFCVSIENMKMDCAALKKAYSPTEILGSVYTYVKPQIEKQPSTIFLFDVVAVSYSHDAIR